MAQPSIKNAGNHLLVSGDLTVKTVGYVRRLAIKQMANQDECVFDLSTIADSDSSALALFLALIRHAHSVSKSIQFQNIPEHLLAVAEVCGIKDVLPQ